MRADGGISDDDLSEDEPGGFDKSSDDEDEEQGEDNEEDRKWLFTRFPLACTFAEIKRNAM